MTGLQAFFVLPQERMERPTFWLPTGCQGHSGVLYKQDLVLSDGGGAMQCGGEMQDCLHSNGATTEALESPAPPNRYGETEVAFHFKCCTFYELDHRLRPFESMECR